MEFQQDLEPPGCLFLDFSAVQLGIPRFGERTPKSLLIFAQLLGARVVSLFKGWVYVAEMGSQDQRTVGLFSC